MPAIFGKESKSMRVPLLGRETVFVEADSKEGGILQDLLMDTKLLVIYHYLSWHGRTLKVR